jgi:SAM-dependent methyltransferase
MDFLEYNRKAWDKQVKEHNKWTIPVSSEDIEAARQGNYTLLLTPTKPTPKSWIEPVAGKKVLCLASGGGQQGPLFAAMGADVTVFDNSPEQLAQDRFVATREGLTIQTIQGDMRDLGCFANETFDLVFHPVSNVFVDDIRSVWKEAYRVLKSGGVLVAGFCNPILYIFDLNHWDNTKELVVKYKIPYSDLVSLPNEEREARIKKGEVLEWGHSLADQIGGQTAAGFVIADFFEDNSGWGDLLDAYIDTFIATKAIKLPR